MKPFLQQTAESILSSHPDGLENVVVVVPGNRSRVYFRKYLTDILRNAWLPQILTMQEFIQDQLEWTVLSREEQLILLFKVYQELPMNQHDDFDAFALWGPTALGDFNTIDTYMLNGEQVFRDLRNIKEIENWSFNSEELSPEQDNFLHFWKMLGDLYSAWNSHCRSNETGSAGLISRVVAENAVGFGHQNDKIYFVGLNTLTKSEQSIVYSLVKSQQASCFWDADEYFVDSEVQEAGLFLRQHREQLGQLDGIGDRLVNNPPSIKVWASSTSVGQAKIAGKILEEIKNDASVGVILGDESLLHPVLNSLPKDKAVNITLGYPLRGSSSENLFDQCVRLMEDAERGAFYHINFKELIKNPLIGLISDTANDDWNKLLEGLVERNLVWVHGGYWENLNNWLSNWLTGLFSVRTKEQAYEALTDLFQEILPRTTAGSLEESQCIRMIELLNDVDNIFRFHDVQLTLKTWARFVHQHINRSSVAFVGEPIEGMQVMGVLESRTLDFDHVIMLGMNEGVFPAKDSVRSFIPHDLRHELKLPGQKEQDAVFAYYFYRLLQKCSKADIICTSETAAIGTSEPSRFIQQIQHELKIPPTFEEVNLPTPEQISPQIKIPSNEQIREKILAHFEYGLSPSAINTFIRCPLDFYHKYVLGLREPDEVKEGVEDSVFGSVIHDTLEKLYDGLEGKPLQVKDIDACKLKSDNMVYKGFAEVFPEESLSSGANLLAMETAQKYVQRFLDWEISQIELLQDKGEHITILELEKELETTMRIDGIEIKVKGKADRIDLTEGKVRIIDYKTGAVKSDSLSFKDGPESIIKPNKDKLVQILCYGYMALQDMDETTNIEAGMISLRSLSNGFISARKNNKSLNSDQITELFPEVLSIIVNRMLGEDFVWQHEEKAKFCDYCLNISEN